MNISSWALKNSKVVYYFVLILLVGGILSYTNMPKLEDPAITVKQAMVVTTYPGASPSEVELQVTDPLEKAIRSMKGVKSVESQSQADVSLITVNLELTVPDNEVEQYWDLLRRKVGDAQSTLPDEAGTSMVMDDYGDVFGMFYAITSDGFSNEELSDYAGIIKREIQNIDGVSKVSIYGEYTPTLEIAIYKDKLANLGVSPLEVITTIQGQHKTVYSGYYETGGERLRLEVNDKYRSVEDLENVIIQGHESDQIRIKDIAKVYESYSNPIRNSMYYDGSPAVGLSISALDGTDILKVGKAVEKRLKELSQDQLPIGIEYHKVFFQPERVSAAINTFLVNLLESVVIVVGILMLFMGIRSGVLLGIVLIITVVGSILFLSITGGTLQRVSLASFILAMGMLVDNAIVIVDGILVDMAKGKPREKALTDIGGQTAMPLLGATLIAILAFLPLFLSPDSAGVYIHDLFVVLCVSLLLSWVLSLVLVPLQADHLLKVQPQDGEMYQGKFYDILRRFLKWGLGHRTIMCVSAVALVLLSLLIYKNLSQSFFPDMSYDQLYIEYKLPEGATPQRVKGDLDDISEYLAAQKDVRHITMSLGGTPSRYNLVRSIAMPSLSYGELIVDFTSQKELVASMDKLQEYLTENYPQAYVRVKRYNLMYSKYPVMAEFSGPDPVVLQELTDKAMDIMNAEPSAILVNSSWGDKTPYLEVQYNQAEARQSGRSRQDISLSLLASSDGIPAATIYEGSRKESIVVRSVDNDGGAIEALETVPSFSTLPSFNSLNAETIYGLISGSVDREDIIAGLLATTPLSQSIDGISLEWEYPYIMRSNGQKAMCAQCNTAPGYSAESVRQAIMEEVEAIELPEGYTMTWKGEHAASSDSVKNLFSTLPYAIAIMIGILILLFKGYRKTLIILISVPMLFVGAMLGLWISGKDMGFVAIAGILGLIGMMIKNGVVLMDEITLRLDNGEDQTTALMESAASRFRPVMMASLTTILGMIPLLSDDMFGSLAAVIMGGLTFGTFVTLVFIPILYSIFFRS